MAIVARDDIQIEPKVYFRILTGVLNHVLFKADSIDGVCAKAGLDAIQEILDFGEYFSE